MFNWIFRLINNYKAYLILIILVISSLILISLNNKKELFFFKQLSLSIAGAWRSIIFPLEEIPIMHSRLKELREENAKLFLENETLKKLSAENESLKKMLGFKQSAKMKIISAVIISKNFSTTNPSFIIDRGTNDGVASDMPVITNKGGVGIIALTAKDYSIIQPLNSLDLKISVQSKRTNVRGILKWTGDKFIISNVTKSADVKVGDVFLSSEVSTIFPPNIPMVKVTEASLNESLSFYDIVVEPIEDLDRVQYVFVLSSPVQMYSIKTYFDSTSTNE